MRQDDTHTLNPGLKKDFRSVSHYSTGSNLKLQNTGKQKKLSPRVTLRLTEDENTRLKHLSQGTTISAYIRKCLFGDKATHRKRRSYRPVQDQESLAKALALLGQSRIANNLNQLAYHANMGTLSVNETTVKQINEAYEQVTTMRDQLIQALGLVERQ